MKRLLAVNQGLDLLLIPGVILALYMAFQYAPRESTMGDVQRIFYFHVPFALGSFLAFGAVLVASLGYLIKRELSWDRAAHAAVEVGFLYCTLVLLTGPVWAKSAWGVWWTWDARLTSTLMLWLIFASYLFLRTYMSDDPRLPRFASVLGILGALNVPVVYYSALWFNVHHPKPVVLRSGGLDPDMAFAFRICMLVLTLLMASLFVKRWLLGRLEAERVLLEAQIQDREDR